MDKKFLGIVISKIDYKEKDNLINIFSADSGLLLCKLKGVKGASSKLKVLASPFCFAEFTGVETNNRIVITGGEVIDTFFDITSNIEKYYAGFVVLDFVKSILKYQNEDSGLLFQIVVNFLKTLSYTEANNRLVLIKALLDIVKVCGYSIDLSNCSMCERELNNGAYIDILDNSVKCENCTSKKNMHLTLNQCELLKEIVKANYENLTFDIDTKNTNELLKFVGNYIYCTFDYTIKINDLLTTYWIG